jgi:Rod binding domain-containing protein
MGDVSGIQSALVPAAPGTAAENNLKGSEPAKIRDAAQQFEGLLLAQILSGVSQGGGGWLGSGEDQSGAAATGFAVQQLAAEIAHQGGLGLANLISVGLERSGRTTSR